MLISKEELLPKLKQYLIDFILNITEQHVGLRGTKEDCLKEFKKLFTKESESTWLFSALYQILGDGNYKEKKRLSEDKELLDEFKNLRRELIPDLQKYIDQVYAECDGKLRDEKDLEGLENRDKVGDVHHLLTTFYIDRNVRSFPFLYLDGKVYIGNSSEDTHTDIINREIKPNSVYIDKVKSIQEVNDLAKEEGKIIISPKTPFATGHVYANKAFIEVLENCDAKTVANALKGQFVAVYDYEPEELTITRLAKRIR